jgi:hypothetical protein
MKFKLLFFISSIIVLLQSCSIFNDDITNHVTIKFDQGKIISSGCLRLNVYSTDSTKAYYTILNKQNYIINESKNEIEIYQLKSKVQNTENLVGPTISYYLPKKTKQLFVELNKNGLIHFLDDINIDNASFELGNNGSIENFKNFKVSNLNLLVKKNGGIYLKNIKSDSINANNLSNGLINLKGISKRFISHHANYINIDSLKVPAN